MKTYVVYESMYGNTHHIASAIAAGLSELGEVTVGSVADIEPTSVVDADLLVVGGPTHMHGMSLSSSRSAAIDNARTDDDLDAEPDAEGPGLRDWFRDLPRAPGMHDAAFDTRLHSAAILTGSAAKGIAKRLEGHRYKVLVDPESFFVEDSDGPLEAGEEERARQWGEVLASRFEALHLT